MTIWNSLRKNEKIHSNKMTVQVFSTYDSSKYLTI